MSNEPVSRKKNYGLNIGTSSVLIIIVILCLVCFAGLSITSANADYRLSQKLAERTTAYYSACNEAQQTLYDLSGRLASFYEQSDSRDAYEQKIKESLTDSFTFDCTINENQILRVSVSPVYPSTPDQDYLQVDSWQVINLFTPELDQSLPVFGSD